MANCHIHENVNAAGDLLVVHHIKPQAFGGDDTPENRVMLCASCHDVLHKAEHKLSKGKKGEAFDLIDRFLPNQAVRQQRLRNLVVAVATARKAWRPSSDVPDAEAKEADTIIVQLDVPAWLHHRLKTAAQDQQIGLYRLCLKVLEQHILKLNDMQIASKAAVEAPVVPEVKLIAPRPKAPRVIQVWNVLDKADAFELSMKMMAAGSKQRYCDIVQKALKLSLLPRHLEDQEFTHDDAVGLLVALFDKLKKAQSRDSDELYVCVLLLVLRNDPVVAKLQSEMPHYKYTKWLLNLFDAV